MSSKDLKIRFESQLSRRNCKIFSTGSALGTLVATASARSRAARSAGRRYASPPDRREEPHVLLAPSPIRSLQGAGSSRRYCSGAERGPLPCRASDRSRRRYRPTRCADLWGRLDGAPRLAQRRVILFFWLMRASSANQISMALGSTPSRPIASRHAEKLF